MEGELALATIVVLEVEVGAMREALVEGSTITGGEVVERQVEGEVESRERHLQVRTGMGKKDRGNVAFVTSRVTRGTNVQ